MYKIFERLAPEPETIHRVAFIDTISGIALVIVDASGNVITGGYVCILTSYGKLRICAGVTEKAGLQTVNGRVRIEY